MVILAEELAGAQEADQSMHWQISRLADERLKLQNGEACPK
jgi:hypothetical protein